MEEKYRLLLFKYLYNELNLHIVESLLVKNNIHYITSELQMCREEKICYMCSKYFYLLNKIDVNYLNDLEIEFLNSVNESDSIDDKIINFLNDTIPNVLFKNAEGKDIYYGPHSKNYLSKDNTIVLGLKYDEFGFAEGKIKKRSEIEKNDIIITNILSFIHNATKYKIQVILYNELFEKLKYSRIGK